MVKEKTKWLRVSKARPCAICEHDDWCGVSQDGTVACCMRIPSLKPIKNDGGFIHQLSGPHLLGLPVQRKKVQVALEQWQGMAAAFYANGQRKRLAASRELGVTVKSLEDLGVGEGRDERRELTYSSWPERNDKGLVTGITRRYTKPVFDGKNKIMLPGGKRGLYYAKEWREARTLFIPEGGSDTAAILSVGLQAVGRPSATGCLPLLASLLSTYNGTIVVLGERDRKDIKDHGECDGCSHCWPGLHGARRTLVRLKQSNPARKVVAMLPPDPFKDARAFLAEYRHITEMEFLASLEEVR